MIFLSGARLFEKIINPTFVEEFWFPLLGLTSIAVAVNAFKPFMSKYRLVLGGGVALLGLAQSITVNIFSLPSAIIINIIPIFLLYLLLYVGLFFLYAFTTQN